MLLLASGQSLQEMLPVLLSWLVAIIVGLTLHEFAHAYAADQVGDPTPRANGRVSLNPIDHYDPVGTTMIVLFGIGWGKPVPVNPFNFRKIRRDSVIVAAAGIMTNIVIAGLAAIPLRFGFAGDYALPLMLMVLLNLILAFFNLLPVGPLDGAGIVEGLLPPRQSQKFTEFSQRWGMILLLVIIFFRPLRDILVWGPVSLLGQLFVGPMWPF
ncbi:MAG: site-2 protease family protein [Armatimonadota bacterium]|jgi:Zn-dependent protease